jgi:uncharacterized protein (TIGR03435 family)
MILNSLSAIWAAIAPALGNHLWQSTLCLVIAGLLTLVLRRNHARARYGIWLAASVKFLIPFSLLIGIGSHLARPRVLPQTEPGFFLAMEQVGQPFTTAATGSQAAEKSRPDTSERYRLVHLLPATLVATWFCGFVLVLFVWYARWRRIFAALREAVALREGREVEALRRLERLGGRQNRIELWLSPASLEPGIFGIVKPVLIWPRGFSEHLEDAHLEAILAHEVWHVRRRDNLAAAVHMVVEAIFWFHPLVWWLGSQLMEERERACDEEVLELGNEPQVYAESILKTCEFCVESPLVCVSGVTGADLKIRIVRIMTRRLANKLSFGRKLILAAFGIPAVAGPVMFGLANAPQIPAQAAQANGAPLPSFEVASIRPGDPHGEWNVNGGAGGRLDATDITVKMLILIAYEIDATRLGELPSWAQSQKFTIRAVGPPNMPKLPNQQMAHLSHQMMQSLLADRFGLRVHRTTKQLPVYELIVAKGGPKIKPMNKADFVAAGRPYDPEISMLHWMPGLPQEHMTALGAAISQLTLALTRDLGRTVVDKTALTGRYDFELTWTSSPGELGSLPGAPGFGGGARADGNGQSTLGASTSVIDSSGPSIFTAIREQLGLKLESTKGPVEVLVIDHVERPSEN